MKGKIKKKKKMEETKCISCGSEANAHSRACMLCHNLYCRNCKRVQLVKIGAKEWAHATCLANVSSPQTASRKHPRGEKKTVIIVRHGQAVHNTYRPFNFAVRDPPLTKKGETQASILAGSDRFRGVQLYACSPLRRAVQTMMRFKLDNAPVILHPCLQEFGPLGAVPCDKGSPVDDVLEWLKPVSCKIDSSLLAEKWWKVTSGCSFNDEAKSRASAFMSWLLSRRESKICIVGHGRTLQRLTTNDKQDKESNPRLKNCGVRVFELNEKGVWSVLQSSDDNKILSSSSQFQKNGTRDDGIASEDSSLGDMSQWVDCKEEEEEEEEELEDSEDDEISSGVTESSIVVDDKTRLIMALVKLRDIDLKSMDEKKIRDMMGDLQTVLKSKSLRSFLCNSDRIKAMRPNCIGCESAEFDSHFRFCADCGVGPYCIQCRRKYMKRRGRKTWGCRICSVVQLGINRPWLKFSSS